MADSPSSAKKSTKTHDLSPIQVSFTLPNPQSLQNHDENDRLALEYEKIEMDRIRLEMEKENHLMKKEKHRIKQKLRQAKLQKLRAETALVKASVASTKLSTFERLAKLGLPHERVLNIYDTFEAVEDEET
ncbi:hypothetical protein KXD40_009607 [Peronospora effusa]|uniref:Uncharacterized protein n=1 Tax=Peronospora effusa TaxID=542832 RepID=A0A3M6VEG7_9STRA|nr:hypothetical protein DD238_003844 [Peronospora effusa]UIZ23788.1 hypothetical protein KXD40_009607 [Peronospora effusa]CAI5700795.1 unnamed protein product [Peronospora effusa]